MSEFPKHILAVDPGDMTGYALIKMDGSLIKWGSMPAKEFYRWLSEYAYENITGIVYEEFKLFKGKAVQQSGSSMHATRVIGGLEVFAAGKDLPLAVQSPRIKQIAEMWSGIKPHGPHSESHKVDAFNHGFYWLCQHGFAMTKQEKRYAADASTKEMG